MGNAIYVTKATILVKLLLNLLERQQSYKSEKCIYVVPNNADTKKSIWCKKCCMNTDDMKRFL